MKILVLNAGSSTLKFKLIDIICEEELISGICEKIGTDGCITYEVGNVNVTKKDIILKDYDDAIECVVKILRNNSEGVSQSILDIDAIGHRVAHGGEKFTSSTIITEEVIQELEKCSELAPLHNLASIKVIKVCVEVFKDIPMVAVFDTAFHQTIPPKAFMYGLPYDVYEKYKVRRYGFHGMSHKYVSVMATEFLGMKYLKSKIVVCHLGNGSSVTAIQNGESVDTSMGFTPLEGLIMGTRSGDIDPSIIGYLVEKMGKSCQDIVKMLNTESGLKGISQLSNDFRDILEAVNQNDYKAKLALDMFVYRTVKYIGSYIAVMNGVDMIVFTGGIGENSTYIREAICENFSYVGVEIDKTIKLENYNCREISTAKSKVRVVMVRTNEELMIAKETYAARGKMI